MVNFMCQLDWSMGCPDIGSNIIRRLLGRVLLDEMNILIHRLSKADCLPKGSWSLCNWLKSWIEQKGTSSDWLDWNMRLKTDTRFSWVSSLQGLRWKLTPSVFLGPQLADCRSQDSFQFTSLHFSRSVLSDSLWPHESQHTRPPVHHQLPEFTQTHVHRVGDAIQPPHPLSSPSPPAPNPSQHQGLFQWVSSLHEVAKVLELQLQHQSFQWTPRADLL